jgi:NADH-quinone oxidoreductase E subunit
MQPSDDTKPSALDGLLVSSEFHAMALSFSPENQARIKKIMSRYPNAMAACLPVLYVAQEQFGYLPPEAQDLVAETLGLPPAHVHGVATFYTMYDKKKVGTYHMQVCTNVSCLICSAQDVLSRCEKKLGIKAGQTTTDGMFTLDEVECLAYCGTAPAVQVNDDIYELISPDKVEELIDSLRAKGPKAASLAKSGS